MRPAPLVTPETPALEALRLMIESGLPGLVVSTSSGLVVVPASQVLRVGLPRYVLDDPSLGRVFDEASGEELLSRTSQHTVADLLALLDDHDDRPDPWVDADTTAVELAAVMSAAHVPMVAVIEGGHLLGVVSANRLVEHLLR